MKRTFGIIAAILLICAASPLVFGGDLSNDGNSTGNSTVNENATAKETPTVKEVIKTKATIPETKKVNKTHKSDNVTKVEKVTKAANITSNSASESSVVNKTETTTSTVKLSVINNTEPVSSASPAQIEQVTQSVGELTDKIETTMSGGGGCAPKVDEITKAVDNFSNEMNNSVIDNGSGELCNYSSDSVSYNSSDMGNIASDIDSIGNVTLDPTNTTIVHVPAGQRADKIINDAISGASAGKTIYLPDGTYVLGDSIILKSGVNLIGAGINKTVIFGNGEIAGGAGSDVIGGYLIGDNVCDVEIAGMRFRSDANEIHDGGDGEGRNCIALLDSDNVKVHDIYFEKYLYSDGVKVRGSKNISIYNCQSISVGHDFVELINSQGSVVNNLIDVMINCGIRLDDSGNSLVSHNTIYDDTGSGWNAIEIEDIQNNNVIDHNIIHDLRGSKGNYAIQYVHGDGDLTVSNNVIWGTTGTVSGGNPKMLNNIICPENQNVSYWTEKGYGYNGNTFEMNFSESNQSFCTNETKEEIKNALFDSADIVKSMQNIMNTSVVQASIDYNLSGDILESSSDDLVTVQQILTVGENNSTKSRLTDEEAEYAKSLIEESQAKTEMYKKITEMSIKNQEIAREMLNKSIETMNSNGTIEGV